MAEAIDFPGSNFTFTAPPGRDDISDLHTFRQHDGPSNVSCWRFTPEELAEVNRTGCCFLTVMSHHLFFPAFVGTEDTVRSVIIDYGSVWKKGIADGEGGVAILDQCPACNGRTFAHTADGFLRCVECKRTYPDADASEAHRNTLYDRIVEQQTEIGALKAQISALSTQPPPVSDVRESETIGPEYWRQQHHRMAQALRETVIPVLQSEAEQHVIADAVEAVREAANMIDAFQGGGNHVER